MSLIQRNPRVWTARALLIGSLFFYGAFSFPFPVEVTVVEIALGGIIVFSIMLNLTASFAAATKYALYGYGFIMLVVLLSFGTIIGILRQNLPSNIIRDVVPLFYMFLPVLGGGISWLVRGDNPNRYLLQLSYAACACAMFFCYRYFNSPDFVFDNIGIGFILGDLSYYQYDPTVIFALLFSTSQVFYLARARVQIYTKFVGIIVFLCVILFTLISFVGIIQRLPMILFLLVIFVEVVLLVRRELFAIMLCFMVMIIAIIWQVWPEYFTLEIFAQKTADHGLISAKLTETSDIFEYFSSDFFLMMSGVGWGGLHYDSTIGSELRFTHNPITFFLLKLGLIGAIAVFTLIGLMLLYCYKYRRRLISFVCSNQNLRPYFIGVFGILMMSFIQPTYKTYTWGLLITPAFWILTHRIGRSSSSAEGIEGASKDSEFAQMPHKGTPIRYGQKQPMWSRQHGAGKIS